jgi:hypothetical protein
MKPFLRAADCRTDLLAPVGWISEPAGTWAGRQVEVVFDPRQHQIVMVRNEPGDYDRAVLAGEGSVAWRSTVSRRCGVRNRAAVALRSNHRTAKSIGATPKARPDPGPWPLMRSPAVLDEREMAG